MGTAASLQDDKVVPSEGAFTPFGGEFPSLGSSSGRDSSDKTVRCWNIAPGSTCTEIYLPNSGRIYGMIRVLTGPRSLKHVHVTENRFTLQGCCNGDETVY
jgi:hypothetical protein